MTPQSSSSSSFGHVLISRRALIGAAALGGGVLAFAAWALLPAAETKVDLADLPPSVAAAVVPNTSEPLPHDGMPGAVLPPVEGAGTIVKNEDMNLSTDEVVRIVDEPSRDVAKRFLTRYYTYYTVETDPNQVVRELSRFATTEYAVKAINLPDKRNIARDEKRWEATDVAFENVSFSGADITHWEADAVVTLREYDGVDVRVVRGHISTEPHSYPWRTGWFVTDWVGTQ